jgi:large subunit ribosomal protein L15
MPLQRRLPKRGFTNIFKRQWIEVKIADLERQFKASDQITPELMAERGLIKSSQLRRFDGVVVLGGGEIKAALNVTAHRFTRGAQAKIEAAGGKVNVIGPPVPTE